MGRGRPSGWDWGHLEAPWGASPRRVCPLGSCRHARMFWNPDAPLLVWALGVRCSMGNAVLGATRAPRLYGLNAGVKQLRELCR